MTKNKTRNIIVEWSKLKHSYLSAIESGTRLKGAQPINSKIEKWYKNPTRVDSWEGGSPAQTAKYLRQGYFAEAFSHSADYAAIATRNNFAFNEDDGELDLDRVFDGHDAIFLDRDERESRPGIRLMIEFAFSASTPAETISQYGAWNASLIKSLESSGYDLVVDVWINLDNLFRGDGDRRSNVLIRVKQENQQSNFTDWSALFAPTGYRQLGFLAKCLAGQQIGKTVTSSFGQCVCDKDWGLTYDRETQTVVINVNQVSSNAILPADRLNEDAISEGLLPAPIKVSGVND